MTESREEAKIRLRGFVEEYVALCNKYQAELVVNSYGVHCVETDAGLTFAFKSVYPEWDVDDEGEEEEEEGEGEDQDET